MIKLLCFVTVYVPNNYYRPIFINYYSTMSSINIVWSVNQLPKTITTLHFRVYPNKRTINSTNGFELLVVQTWIVMFVISFPKNSDASEQEVEMKIEVTWESLFIKFEVLILWWAHYVGVTIQMKPLWYTNVVRYHLFSAVWKYNIERSSTGKTHLGYSYQEQIRSLWRRAMMLIMMGHISFDYVFFFFLSFFLSLSLSLSFSLSLFCFFSSATDQIITNLHFYIYANKWTINFNQ